MFVMFYNYIYFSLSQSVFVFTVSYERWRWCLDNTAPLWTESTTQQ